jgi:hypothetical protein
MPLECLNCTLTCNLQDNPNLRRVIDFHCVDEIIDSVELLLRRFDDVVEERREIKVSNVFHERHLNISLKRVENGQNSASTAKLLLS